MLKDPKVRALAVEFGGNWLDFRRFEELNTVDRERFSTFNNELREAMFEEPVRFMLDVCQNNRSVLDCPVCQSHVCESDRWQSIMACRFPTLAPTIGSASTMPIALVAADCCRWRCS